MRGPKTTLTLERKSLTDDAMGGKIETWADVRNIKGVLCTIDGDERLSADKLTVISSHHFYIDFLHGETISATDRFSMGTRTFKIKYPNNIGANTNRKLKITLLEEV